jgi:hypothetical protein
MDVTRTALTDRDIAVRSIHLMARGERAEFDALYAPTAVDHENVVQPPSSRVPGAAGFWSTAQWLRTAFADLRYDIHHVVTDGQFHDERTAHIAYRLLHAGRDDRRRLPAHRPDLRDDTISLVPRQRKAHHRTLGQSRRPRHRQATAVDPANPGVPVQNGASQATGAQTAEAACLAVGTAFEP